MPVAPAASDGMSLAPVIKAEGAPLPEAWLAALLELRVRRALRTIGRCTLRFADPGYRLGSASKLKVGAELSVAAKGVEAHASSTTVFEGMVTSTGVEVRDGGQPELVVVAQDLAYELSRTARAATYLNQTASDLVTKVLHDLAVRAQVDSTSTVMEYTLQTDTDLAFIDELCRRSGLDWEVDGSTFHAWRAPNGAAPSGTRVPLTVGESLRDFSAKVFADAPQQVTVRGWDHLNKKAVRGQATTSRAAVPSGLDALAPKAAIKPATVLDAQAAPLSEVDADALAEIAGASVGVVHARGRCMITPQLRPGVVAHVADAGPASGDYYVREVEHTFRPSGLHTTFVAGDRETPGLAVDAAAPTRSSFTHEGLVVGLVTAIDNDPKKAGRVKVSLPGLDTTIESQWARLAVLGGGASRGMVFVPEVGDEVLVGFEAGDVRRPVVLGGLFGSKDAIPAELVAAGGTVANRRLTSRLGHVVELGDGAGPAAQHIRMALAGGAESLRLGKDRADLKLPSGVPLKITVGSSFIELDGNGAITLSGTTIALKATQGLTLEGLDVTAKATGKFAASGTQAELKGSGTTTVESSGMTAVKGSMVAIN